MKKIIFLVAMACILLTAFSVLAFADAGEPSESYVYVTLSDKGMLVAAAQKITMTDADGDGALTVNDALYILHEIRYEGGVEAGYGSYMGDLGLSLSKLWGDTSGSYGYYVNNVSCMSLADTIKDGDHISAFVYKNSDWSDIYSYFDKLDAICTEGDSITLTLTASGYDENWNPIAYPVAGAKITVNGELADLVTDDEGRVTLTVDEAGELVISAVSDSKTLVPPVFCVLAREADSQLTPPSGSPLIATAIAVVVAAVITVAVVYAVRQKNKNAK